MDPSEPATSEWHGCFDVRGWLGQVVRDALSQPAKFAYGEIERIVRHGLDQGHWRQGELIGDPFGGVGLGGIMRSNRFSMPSLWRISACTACASMRWGRRRG